MWETSKRKSCDAHPTLLGCTFCHNVKTCNRFDTVQIYFFQLDLNGIQLLWRSKSAGPSAGQLGACFGACGRTSALAYSTSSHTLDFYCTDRADELAARASAGGSAVRLWPSGCSIAAAVGASGFLDFNAYADPHADPEGVWRSLLHVCPHSLNSTLHP